MLLNHRSRRHLQSRDGPAPLPRSACPREARLRLIDGPRMPIMAARYEWADNARCLKAPIPFARDRTVRVDLCLHCQLTEKVEWSGTLSSRSSRQRWGRRAASGWSESCSVIAALTGPSWRSPMDYYAGLDASLETVNVCIVDGDGSVLLEQKVRLALNRRRSSHF